MRKVNSFIIIVFLVSGVLFADQKYNGVWSDETRHSPTNPSNFICIEQLPDDRFFIISNHFDQDNNPIWETSIGFIKNGMLYTKFSDGEWRLKFWINKSNNECITMESVSNSDMVLGLGRVSEQPIKKLEGTVRKERFTK